MNDTVGKVRIDGATLAFPCLWDARRVNDQGDPKFGAAFLFPPDHPCVKKIKDAMAAVAKAKWGPKAAEIYKSLKASDRLALHDGASKSQYAGYEGKLYVQASNQLRPTVVDGNRIPLDAASGKPYAGCIVNGIVEFWAQDNKYGKRINASLQGVQFVADGERLAGGGVAGEDEFEEIPEAETASDNFDDDTVADSDEDPFA